MIRKALSLILLLLHPLFADESAGPVSCMPSGRRMAVLPVQGKTLTGKTPEGAGAPFRIQSGCLVLWEGQAGEAFSISPGAGHSHLYLVSETANNLRWQNLAWHGKLEASLAGGGVTLHAEENGVAPGTGDCGPALRRLLEQARNMGSHRGEGDGGCTISFPKGEYHFYPEGALRVSLYISNHDQQDTQLVGVPLADLDRVTLEGNGSTFIFHDRMLPFLVMDSRRVRCRNIHVAYAEPFAAEAKVTEIGNGSLTARFAGPCQWRIEDGRLYVGKESKPVNHALAFEEDGAMAPTGLPGDIELDGEAVQTGPDAVQFAVGKSVGGLRAGHTLVLRNYERPHPAMLLYRTEDTTLDNVVIHDSQGMGLLAQRSRNISMNGGGCIRTKGRMHTTAADATHFSNCAGLVKVQGALFEGMMDDAINVHATCLRIAERTGKREIIVQYMHPQAVGFEVFLPGERVRFIRGHSLENVGKSAKAIRVERLDETRLKLTLDRALPPGIDVGDAVENADWHPAVQFINNTVRHNRARGALFTTPEPVLVKDCRFERSHGSAILLAGDARGWYESGACQKVEIINNLFDHNLTAHYQFCAAVISIFPEVEEPQAQKERYHRNILIKGNTFLTHRVPLLFAVSAKGITFTDNAITRDSLYPGMGGGQDVILHYCDNVIWNDASPAQAPAKDDSPHH